jgi:hypothetical protein
VSSDEMRQAAELIRDELPDGFIAPAWEQVADWLDTAADELSAWRAQIGGEPIYKADSHIGHALRVARAYLSGGDQ